MNENTHFQNDQIVILAEPGHRYGKIGYIKNIQFESIDFVELKEHHSKELDLKNINALPRINNQYVLHHLDIDCLNYVKNLVDISIDSLNLKIERENRKDLPNCVESLKADLLNEIIRKEKFDIYYQGQILKLNLIG